MLISDVSLNDASVCMELTDEWTNVCWSTKQNCGQSGLFCYTYLLDSYLSVG